MGSNIDRLFAILFYASGMLGFTLFCLNEGLDYWFKISVMMFLIAIFLRGSTHNGD